MQSPTETVVQWLIEDQTYVPNIPDIRAPLRILEKNKKANIDSFENIPYAVALNLWAGNYDDCLKLLVKLPAEAVRFESMFPVICLISWYCDSKFGSFPTMWQFRGKKRPFPFKHVADILIRPAMKVARISDDSCGKTLYIDFPIVEAQDSAKRYTLQKLDWLLKNLDHCDVRRILCHDLLFCGEPGYELSLSLARKNLEIYPGNYLDQRVVVKCLKNLKRFDEAQLAVSDFTKRMPYPRRSPLCYQFRGESSRKTSPMILLWNFHVGRSTEPFSFPKTLVALNHCLKVGWELFRRPRPVTHYVVTTFWHMNLGGTITKNDLQIQDNLVERRLSVDELIQGQTGEVIWPTGGIDLI